MTIYLSMTRGGARSTKRQRRCIAGRLSHAHRGNKNSPYSGGPCRRRLADEPAVHLARGPHRRPHLARVNGASPFSRAETWARARPRAAARWSANSRCLPRRRDGFDERPWSQPDRYNTRQITHRTRDGVFTLGIQTLLWIRWKHICIGSSHTVQKTRSFSADNFFADTPRAS